MLFLHTFPFEKLFIEFENFGLKMPHTMFSDATSKSLCSTFHLGNTFFGCKMTSDVQLEDRTAFPGLLVVGGGS